MSKRVRNSKGKATSNSREVYRHPTKASNSTTGEVYLTEDNRKRYAYAIEYNEGNRVLADILEDGKTAGKAGDKLSKRAAEHAIGVSHGKTNGVFARYFIEMALLKHVKKAA